MNDYILLYFNSAFNNYLLLIRRSLFQATAAFSGFQQ